MQVLVTGATGLIGNAVARLLVGQGQAVRALVRDPGKAERLLPKEVVLLRGDITDPASVRAAAQGVEILYHTAGMPEQWQADEAIFDRVNHRGTRNLLEAASAERVRRVIYTSTMDVFAAPNGGTLIETQLDPAPKHTAYERSKQAAEREVEVFLRRDLDVVLLNPAAVYGPSPVHVGLNSFFIKLLNRQVPLLPPGGMSIAYVEGVARAHLAAAERGRKGERYLLADTFVTNAQLAEETARQTGLARSGVPPTAPAWLFKAAAAAMAPLARRLHFTPLIAPGQLSFLLWSVRVDASKAQRELGFQPTPLSQGVAKTLEALRAEGLIPR
jgi:dihydroflavonol-4-reductase